MKKDVIPGEPTLRDEALDRIKALLADMDVAMLTTESSDAELRSRPMTLEKRDFDGELYFLASSSMTARKDIAASPRVNVSCADSKGHRYLALSGDAEWLDDRERIRAMWRAWYSAFFPGGPEDPGLGLIRIKVTWAEYWDSPGTMALVWSLAKSVVTGGHPETATEHHGSVRLDGTTV